MANNSDKKRLGSSEEILILSFSLACLAVHLYLYRHETLSNKVNLYFSPNLFHVLSLNVKVRNAINL